MFQKFKASIKPSSKWGPKDPISRHNWLQWNSKTQQGERDFTLKRKGTRDYTRSIKKQKKVTISELSTLSVEGVYKNANPKQSISSTEGGNIYTELTNALSPNVLNGSSETLSTLRATSLPNTSASRSSNNVANKFRVASLPNNLDINEESTGKYYDPMSDTDRKKKFQENGTLRKGPYVITGDIEADHVCQRKFSDNKEVTEL